MEGWVLTDFDQAWALLKMPVYLDQDEPDWEESGLDEEDFVSRIPVNIRGPMYQGRRAGDPDTGYWTPHKDKALAYAMYGSDYSDPYHRNKPYFDAREVIPEIYQLDIPDDVEQRMRVDHEYMGEGEDNWGNALRDRRVSGYATPHHREKTPEELSQMKPYRRRNYEAFDQPYHIDQQYISRIPDSEVADMIEAVDRGLYPEEDFMNVFALKNKGFENIWWNDHPSDQALRAELTMDTGTTGGRVAQGSSLSDYVASLRERNL